MPQSATSTRKKKKKKKKTENEIFKIVSPEECLNFFVDKDKNKNSLSFQLTKWKNPKT